MKIAVVGAGASGLVATRKLIHQGHDVSVFEAGRRFGGHAHSVSLSECAPTPIEAGFVIFNDAACPHLAALLGELHVSTRPIRVEYEIANPHSKTVLRGKSLRELLSVPMNLTVPSFYRVVPDWIRFLQHARQLVQCQSAPMSETLGEFLRGRSYSRAFAEQFVYPLAGAVYPGHREVLESTPLAALLCFIDNHGLLNKTQSPSCRTLVGGSRAYLDCLCDSFRDRIQLNCPVSSIARNDDYALLKFANRPRERFDQVVLAVHADVALRLLADPTRLERQTLGAFDYAPQNVYIHTDDGPEGDSDAGAVWRFQPATTGCGAAELSYRISEVQRIDVPQHLMITMSGAEQPPPQRVLKAIQFRRPMFSPRSVRAQRRLARLNGQRRTYFCGAYWGFGFHEDAVRSAEQAADQLALHTEEHAPVQA